MQEELKSRQDNDVSDLVDLPEILGQLVSIRFSRLKRIREEILNYLKPS